MFSILLTEMLNRIAKHRTWHRRGVLVQETQELPAIDVAGRAQHPTGRFVNQVLFVAEQHLGDLKGVSSIAVPDQLTGRYDRSSPLPNVFRTCKSVQDIARMIAQVDAEDVERAQIDQVPIIDSIVTP